jgi:hypothetical protein
VVSTGIVSLIALLAAGCAGAGRNEEAAAVETSAGTGASADGTSATTVPTSTPTSRGASTTGGTSATTRGGTATSRPGGGTTRSQTTRKSSPTTRRTTPTTEPKVELTVSIDDPDSLGASVKVNGREPACASSCSFSFAKGTPITLDPIPIEDNFGWRSSGGQIQCDPDSASSCSFTINDDLTVTAKFSADPEEGS